MKKIIIHHTAVVDCLRLLGLKTYFWTTIHKPIRIALEVHHGSTDISKFYIGKFKNDYYLLFDKTNKDALLLTKHPSTELHKSLSAKRLLIRKT